MLKKYYSLTTFGFYNEKCLDSVLVDSKTEKAIRAHCCAWPKAINNSGEIVISDKDFCDWDAETETWIEDTEAYTAEKKEESRLALKSTRDLALATATVEVYEMVFDARYKELANLNEAIEIGQDWWITKSNDFITVTIEELTAIRDAVRLEGKEIWNTWKDAVENL